MLGRHELAEALPVIVWTHDNEGNATYFNPRWTEYTGMTLAETVEKGPESLVHPDDRDAVVELFAEARVSGRSFSTTYRLRSKDGTYRWHEAHVAPAKTESGKVTSFVGTAIDVDERTRAADEQRFFIEATKVLGSSLDVEKTLADVARLVVPKLADWCAIDLVEPGGTTLRRAAVAHVDESKVELASTLFAKRPPRADDPHGSFAVIRTRKTEHLAHLTDDVLVAYAAGDDEVLALLRGLGLRASICVPLVARGHVLGALTLVVAESAKAYGERDVAFAEDFAQRISVALDNARLYSEATRAKQAAEALAADVMEQSKNVEAALATMRAERDAAVAKAGNALGT